jgi:hypothetical protein
MEENAAALSALSTEERATLLSLMQRIIAANR